MGRIKKTIIYLLLAAFLLYYLTGIFGLFLTPERLVAANEQGLHYGPSEMLVKHKSSGGKCIIIGQLEDDRYSVYEMERTMGIFWMRDGAAGSFSVMFDTEVRFYTDTRTVLITAKNPDIREVFFKLPVGTAEPQKDWRYSDTVELDENGFAFLDLYDELDTEQSGRVLAADYVEGRDADGNVIWSSNENLY